jgi:hypothetical protein
LHFVSKCTKYHKYAESQMLHVHSTLNHVGTLNHVAPSNRIVVVPLQNRSVMSTWQGMNWPKIVGNQQKCHDASTNEKAWATTTKHQQPTTINSDSCFKAVHMQWDKKIKRTIEKHANKICYYRIIVMLTARFINDAF